MVNISGWDVPQRTEVSSRNNVVRSPDMDIILTRKGSRRRKYRLGGEPVVYRKKPARNKASLNNISNHLVEFQLFFIVFTEFQVPAQFSKRSYTFGAWFYFYKIMKNKSPFNWTVNYHVSS
jgi:hypothetical protein